MEMNSGCDLGGMRSMKILEELFSLILLLANNIL